MQFLLRDDYHHRRDGIYDHNHHEAPDLPQCEHRVAVVVRERDQALRDLLLPRLVQCALLPELPAGALLRRDLRFLLDHEHHHVFDDKLDDLHKLVELDKFDQPDKHHGLDDLVQLDNLCVLDDVIHEQQNKHFELDCYKQHDVHKLVELYHIWDNIFHDLCNLIYHELKHRDHLIDKHYLPQLRVWGHRREWQELR